MSPGGESEDGCHRGGQDRCEPSGKPELFSSWGSSWCLTGSLCIDPSYDEVHLLIDVLDEFSEHIEFLFDRLGRITGRGHLFVCSVEITFDITYMQQGPGNSASAYIQAQPCTPCDMKRTTPGHVAMGPNTSAVAGVSAVESIPSHSLFSLCTPTECLDASIDQRDAKGRRARSTASESDAIVGEIERAPGESRLDAAAFTSDDTKQVRQKQSGGPQYRANDFTPYRRL